MGNFCLRTRERLDASKGLIKSAETKFQDNKDVQSAGLLISIAGLIHAGLFKYLDRYFDLENGFYGIKHIIMTLAFMYYLGLKFPENLINVYTGKLADLPKRQKICQKGKTDYWVNDQKGNPFFVISKTVDPGLQKVIYHDILPILKSKVPNQPTKMIKNYLDLCLFLIERVIVLNFFQNYGQKG